MHNLKQLKNRIKTIESTQKIVKAMQLISSKKLLKMKSEAESAKNYLFIIKDIMDEIKLNANFIKLSPFEENFFYEKGEKREKNHLCIVITSERGLCGNLNLQIIKLLKHDIKQYQEKNFEVKIIVAGKKGYDALKTKYSDLFIACHYITKNRYFPIELEIKNQLVSLVKENKIQSCSVYYNKFQNALIQVTSKLNIFPIQAIKTFKDGKNNISPYSPFKYEGYDLIASLVDLYLLSVIKNCFLQNKASEEAARVIAMDSAAKNAGDLIKRLTLQLNRSRQAIITTELTEIISGAKAL